ncbi:MAG: hypothetical protein AABX93_02650 [Nanoarchaeota archaeon]
MIKKEDGRRIYCGRNNFVLPFEDGLIDFLDVSEWNDQRKDIVSKFVLKDNDLIFVFDPPVKEIYGNVRVHYELNTTSVGKYGKVICLEVKDSGLVALSKHFGINYRFE